MESDMTGTYADREADGKAGDKARTSVQQKNSEQSHCEGDSRKENPFRISAQKNARNQSE